MDSVADNLARAAKVRLMIFDVDGVLTDGSLHFGPDGEMMKTFNVHDGLGIKLLQESGVQTAIISARRSAITARRAQDLGFTHVHQGGHDKLTPFRELLALTGLTEEQCGYIGDDVVDAPLLKRVGFAVSVPNGRPEAQALSHLVTQAGGGKGAVREICEFLLRAQDNYERVMAPFLE
ncbi:MULTISPECIES: HAD family hydrolase [unclassified Janthinobacterium]|uniref:KdsC family phosphatase n=1 Tax=unclassified Janthinobacterium TaxID=2610881 RepID=UPI00161B8A79|nr:MULTISPECIES: HAD hydrolase family protein [unclassified Janthinobacterium]MBB5370790.1 3-deoxy-D-manno-octulosonate 8-phosphate phosphatase (KDO 8-P phosphatase) [Janthinobacterium sp. K2C7]MBB5383596.1 3-deoxy-D-manno-octulosonate 8-phosphate phosphatase (KDO 8-P phosphatase) [Janthinobacterium sp. K2Li3]MBB5389050.1 3-deoxy-D-manno-octulosonate 8-phosphate phosphatase (KDO 8-P phosphatase) [Janthinobacterium sp. K2E3]